jgi:hypothetical protein
MASRKPTTISCLVSPRETASLGIVTDATARAKQVKDIAKVAKSFDAIDGFRSRRPRGSSGVSCMVAVGWPPLSRSISVVAYIFARSPIDRMIVV